MALDGNKFALPGLLWIFGIIALVSDASLKKKVKQAWQDRTVTVTEGKCPFCGAQIPRAVSKCPKCYEEWA
jgi:hypothetical protein